MKFALYLFFCTVVHFLFRSPQERNGTVFDFEQYHRKVTSEIKVIQSFASILAETSITFRIVQ